MDEKSYNHLFLWTLCKSWF